MAMTADGKIATANRAVTLPDAAGKRFMVTNGDYSFKQVLIISSFTLI